MSVGGKSQGRQTSCILFYWRPIMVNSPILIAYCPPTVRHSFAHHTLPTANPLPTTHSLPTPLNATHPHTHCISGRRLLHLYAQVQAHPRGLGTALCDRGGHGAAAPARHGRGLPRPQAREYPALRGWTPENSLTSGSPGKGLRAQRRSDLVP